MGGGQAAKVLVSSTSEDLKDYREAASKAALAAGMLPVMMEYFAASGDKPPLSACLDKVSQADVLIVIVAHRYGWVPPRQGKARHKSITWLECEQVPTARQGCRSSVASPVRCPATPRRAVRPRSDGPDQFRFPHRKRPTLRPRCGAPRLKFPFGS